jgi:2-keto-3-deoxy-6-phosphogluconate aldolase
VIGVGMGSKLITKQLLDSNNYNFIEKETSKLLTLIRSIK